MTSLMTLTNSALSVGQVAYLVASATYFSYSALMPVLTVAVVPLANVTVQSPVGVAAYVAPVY